MTKQGVKNERKFKKVKLHTVAESVARQLKLLSLSTCVLESGMLATSICSWQAMKAATTRDNLQWTGALWSLSINR